MDLYEQNLSDVTLNKRSVSGNYVGELYIAIRMKMIKSLMYDINKKFHISYMGDF